MKTVITIALVLAGWTLATWGAVLALRALWIWPFSFGILLLLAAAAVFALDFLEARAKLRSGGTDAPK